MAHHPLHYQLTHHHKAPRAAFQLLTVRNFPWKGRPDQIQKRSSICWFSAQMDTTARVRQVQSWERRAYFASPTLVQGPKVLGHSLLLPCCKYLLASLEQPGMDDVAGPSSGFPSHLNPITYTQYQSLHDTATLRLLLSPLSSLLPRPWLNPQPPPLSLQTIQANR